MLLSAKARDGPQIFLPRERQNKRTLKSRTDHDLLPGWLWFYGLHVFFLCCRRKNHFCAIGDFIQKFRSLRYTGMNTALRNLRSFQRPCGHSICYTDLSVNKLIHRIWIYRLGTMRMFGATTGKWTKPGPLEKLARLMLRVEYFSRFIHLSVVLVLAYWVL